MARPTGKRKAKKGRWWKLTPDWSRWDREVQGVRGFLKRLKDSTHPDGDAWRDGMAKHYRARLKELRDNEPQKYR